VTATAQDWQRARAVADAVLYEGYALYPYRASSAKNRVRWQFGVLAPRAWSENGGCEPWSLQCECLLEPDDGARLHGMLRCLQIQRRTVEEATGEPDADGAPGFRPVPSLQIDDRLLVTWEEGVEREVPFELALAPLPGGTACPAPVGTPQLRTTDFAFPARREVETLVDAAGRMRGRVVREQGPIGGVVRVDATRLRLPYALTKVRVRVENLTTCTLGAVPREEILASSLVGAHVLLAVDPGTFLSLVDPPEWGGGAGGGGGPPPPAWIKTRLQAVQARRAAQPL